MTEDQIKHMVSRFLCWPLPEDFGPDNGISFEATYGGLDGRRVRREPSGTNLLTGTQAEAMVRHMIFGMPESKPATLEDLLRVTTKEQSVINGEIIDVRPDFRVSVQGERDGGIHFIIHPSGVNGETLDFIVRGDDLARL